MELRLPNPISTNRLYRYVGRRVLISREGRAYREAVAAIIARRRLRPLSGPLAIEIDIHPPNRRMYDLDNRLKCLFDALQHGGAFHDDSQIVLLFARKCAPVPGGMAIVRIEVTDGCNDPDSKHQAASLPEM
jgi:crossover junction endodeoxyribonuclease RusA